MRLNLAPTGLTFSYPLKIPHKKYISYSLHISLGTSGEKVKSTISI